MHGGDIYRNQVRLDFSVNINPLGVPETVREVLRQAAMLCDRYPDIKAERLKKAVGAMLGVPQEYLLFGNGASELFMALVHAVKPKKIVIPVPSFYGYEYAARAAGCEVIYHELRAENGFCATEDLDGVLTEDVDLLFLANPNNPTGNLAGRETLKRILLHCGEKGIYVVLDECFIEFCGSEHSMLSGVEEFEHLILVRAFTKIFSIPGVRLGYLICRDQTLRRKTAGQLPEWNLSVFAQEAGCICAEQRAFIEKTKGIVESERKFLEEGLRRKGFRVFSSSADFILFYSGEPLYEKLLERGILIRDCGNFRGLCQGFYRIAVKSRGENEVLLENL